MYWRAVKAAINSCYQDTSGLRTSTSDSMLMCDRDAARARSLSSDNLLASRPSSSHDEPETSGSEVRRHRTLSSYDLASKKCKPLGSIGPQGSFSQEYTKSRSLTSSDQHISELGKTASQENLDDKEQSVSKKFFGLFSSKSPPPPAKKDQQKLAQEMFKRRTVSSGNLFPNKSSLPSKRGELSRSSSQDQPKQSLFQIFSKKHEPIDET